MRPAPSPVALPRPKGHPFPFAALRHREYRLFWTGLLGSVVGYQMAHLGMGWLVYELTGRPRIIALLGLATVGPALLLTMVGGVLADRRERRRLIIASEGGMTALMGVTAVLTLGGWVEVWHLLAVAAATSAIFALEIPVRQALFPRLLPRAALASAVALNSAVWQGARIIGPALGGLLIARAHVGWLFALAGLGALLMAGAVGLLRPLPGEGRPSSGSLAHMAEGVRFVRQNSPFAALIGLAFVATLFGMSYLFLLPVFAKDVLRVGAEGLGFLSAAGGAGSLLAAMGAGALGGIPHRGVLLLGGAAGFGLLLIAFAFSPWYPLSLFLLLLAGGAGSVYMVLTMTTLQERVPEHLRGRVMGIFSAAWSLIPLGAVQSGLLADLLGAPWAVALGGLVTLGAALGAALTSPSLRRLRPLAAEPLPAPAG
jgi:MFS family permease